MDKVMPLEPSRISHIEIPSTLFALPLVIWLTLYSAERWLSLNSRPILPWLKALRWIGWVLGVVLLLLSVTSAHLRWVYGVAVMTFSGGLSIPESWIRWRHRA